MTALTRRCGQAAPDAAVANGRQLYRAQGPLPLLLAIAVAYKQLLPEQGWTVGAWTLRVKDVPFLGWTAISVLLLLLDGLASVIYASAGLYAGWVYLRFLQVRLVRARRQAPAAAVALTPHAHTSGPPRCRSRARAAMGTATRRLRLPPSSLTNSSTDRALHSHPPPARNGGRSPRHPSRRATAGGGQTLHPRHLDRGLPGLGPPSLVRTHRAAGARHGRKPLPIRRHQLRRAYVVIPARK